MHDGPLDQKVLEYYEERQSIRYAAAKAGVSFSKAQRILAQAGSLDGESVQQKIDAAVAKASEAKQRPRRDDATILKWLKKCPKPIESLADDVAGPADLWIDARKAEGYNLFVRDGLVSLEKTPAARTTYAATEFEIFSDENNEFTFGALGDTHLCSKYERLDVLNDLYDRFEQAEIKNVFHAGNYIDGEARFNRYDLSVHGLDAQIKYLSEHYPKRHGITTFAVSGDDHEGWYCQREGVDIGRYAQSAMVAAGHSWVDLGYMESFVKLTNANSGESAMLHVIHPGGGSAYATSYTVQKIAESYAGGEKPAIALVGHYHKLEIINVRGVWMVQTGCTQDQTPFMRKKKLQSGVGGHIIRATQDPETGAIVLLNGIHQYFNQGYYNGRWSLSGPVNLPRRILGGAR